GTGDLLSMGEKQIPRTIERCPRNDKQRVIPSASEGPAFVLKPSASLDRSDRFADHARREEDQQLGFLARPRRLLEQIAEARQVAKERDLGQIAADRLFEYSADYRS